MARGSFARRLLVAGTVVWVARWAVSKVRRSLPRSRHPRTCRTRQSRRSHRVTRSASASRRASRSRCSSSPAPRSPQARGTSSRRSTICRLLLRRSSTRRRLRPSQTKRPRPGWVDPHRRRIRPMLSRSARASPPWRQRRSRQLQPQPRPRPRQSIRAGAPPCRCRLAGSPPRTRCPCRPRSPRFPFEAIAFNPHAWLHANPASPTGASAVAIAQHYLGRAIPLGRRRSGVGLRLLRAHAIRLCAARDQPSPLRGLAVRGPFAKLDPADLQPGDLVFFEPTFDGLDTSRSTSATTR